MKDFRFHPLQWLCVLAMLIVAILAASTAHAGDCHTNGAGVLQLNGGHCQAVQQLRVVQPYVAAPVVQQVIVPQVQYQYVQPQAVIVQKQVHGHAAVVRQNVIVQRVVQPRQRATVQRQRIVTRSR